VLSGCGGGGGEKSSDKAASQSALNISSLVFLEEGGREGHGGLILDIAALCWAMIGGDGGNYEIHL
jgi:hypothetical protein